MYANPIATNVMSCVFNFQIVLISSSKLWDIRVPGCVVILYAVLAGHFFHVMVGSLFPHVPSVPSDMLPVHFRSVRVLRTLRDYLRGWFVLQDLLTDEISDFQCGFTHVTFSCGYIPRCDTTHKLAEVQICWENCRLRKTKCKHLFPTIFVIARVTTYVRCIDLSRLKAVDGETKDTRHVELDKMGEINDPYGVTVMSLSSWQWEQGVRDNRVSWRAVVSWGDPSKFVWRTSSIVSYP